MPKVYFNDLVFRNSLLKLHAFVDFGPGKRALYKDNAFLRAKHLHSSDAIHFWRTSEGNEIDFVISKKYNQGESLEIKFDEASFTISKYKRSTGAHPTYSLYCRAFHTESSQRSLLAF